MASRSGNQVASRGGAGAAQNAAKKTVRRAYFPNWSPVTFSVNRISVGAKMLFRMDEPSFDGDSLFFEFWAGTDVAFQVVFHEISGEPRRKVVLRCRVQGQWLHRQIRYYGNGSAKGDFNISVGTNSNEAYSNDSHVAMFAHCIALNSLSSVKIDANYGRWNPEVELTGIDTRL